MCRRHAAICLSFAAVVLVVAAGCSTTAAGWIQFSPQIESVTRPEEAAALYGGQPTSVQADAEVTGIVFEDDLVSVVWRPTLSNAFSFTLTNKTTEPLKILWADAVWVDTEVTSHRVVPAGTTYANRDQTPASTVVAGGSSVTDTIFLADHLYLGEGGVQHRPLVSYADAPWSGNALIYEGYGADGWNKAIAYYARVNERSSVRALLPIEVGGVTYNYSWTFRLTPKAVYPQAPEEEAAPGGSERPVPTRPAAIFN